jgi:hypothetical protein
MGVPAKNFGVQAWGCGLGMVLMLFQHGLEWRDEKRRGTGPLGGTKGWMDDSDDGKGDDGPGMDNGRGIDRTMGSDGGADGGGGGGIYITPKQACDLPSRGSEPRTSLCPACQPGLATTPKLTGGHDVARGPDRVVGFALRPAWTKSVDVKSGRRRGTLSRPRAGRVPVGRHVVTGECRPVNIRSEGRLRSKR